MLLSGSQPTSTESKALGVSDGIFHLNQGLKGFCCTPRFESHKLFEMYVLGFQFLLGRLLDIELRDSEVNNLSRLFKMGIIIFAHLVSGDYYED